MSCIVRLTVFDSNTHGTHVTLRTLWHNARLVTCDDSMRVFEHGALITADDRIEWLGDERDVPSESKIDARFDVQGRLLTPGLIDCHTHLVFAGNRAAEWSELLRGASYEDIARRGGGILSTVNATRRTSEAQLFDESAPRLEYLFAEGVTTVEIKSGYGLTLNDERKMLRVARALERHYLVTIRTTFLAAHAVPPEFAGRADDYIDEVANVWLPTLHAEGLIDAVDVFCESIAFNVEHSKRVLSTAVSLGLPVRMHAEQLSNIGASRLAAQFRALSCDHLEYTNERDIQAMVESGTVAVLLPTAFLHLGETKLPPIESLRAHGASIAVASDCNPGSAPSPSLLLAGALATRLFRLTPIEVMTGITRNAARACGAIDRGSLRPNAIADFAMWDAQAVEELFYWLSAVEPVAVVRAGQVVRGTRSMSRPID